MMRRPLSLAVSGLLIVLLLVSVVLDVWVLPASIGRIVQTFPEVAPLETPAIVWGVVAIACWQAIVLIGLRLASLARHRQLSTGPRGWLRAILVFLLVFLALVTSAFVALQVMDYATPGVMLGLFGVGLIALIAVVLLSLFLGMSATVPPAVDATHPDTRGGIS